MKLTDSQFAQGMDALNDVVSDLQALDDAGFSLKALVRILQEPDPVEAFNLAWLRTDPWMGFGTMPYDGQCVVAVQALDVCFQKTVHVERDRYERIHAWPTGDSSKSVQLPLNGEDYVEITPNVRAIATGLGLNFQVRRHLLFR